MPAASIAIDFDDVLMQTTSVFCIWHNTQYGTHLSETDFTAWGLSSKLGCSGEEVRVRLTAFYRSSEHRAAPVVDGAREALKRMKEAGVEIHIVSARDESARTTSEEWLHHQAISYHTLHCLDHLPHSPNPGKTKGEWCRDAGALALIDDGEHNVRDAAKYGIRAYLFSKPWNTAITDTPAVRIDTWDEVLAHLVKDGILKVI